ncbi:MAG: hypothetical protein M0Z28_26845, partial [Rhodospirillales bacterium]|nr:hypothetical protein [Rhodospirillales bacterium]
MDAAKFGDPIDGAPGGKPEGCQTGPARRSDLHANNRRRSVRFPIFAHVVAAAGRYSAACVAPTATHVRFSRIVVILRQYAPLARQLRPPVGVAHEKNIAGAVSSCLNLP